MGIVKLNRRLLSSIESVDRTTVLYDTDLKGFGLRLTPPSVKNPQGARTWIIEYRPGAGGRNTAKKRISLGSIDAMSPEQARSQAKTLLASIRLGDDPGKDRITARTAKNLTELRLIYAAECDHLRKMRTVSLYNSYWNKHILPAIGAIPINQITKSDISRLHRDIGRSHSATANRIVTLLAHFFRWAMDHNHIPHASSPSDGLRKFAETSRERFLTKEEIHRLGAAIDKAETVGVAWPSNDRPLSKFAPSNDAHRRVLIEPSTADAVRLLLFTGCRLREILNLRWEFVDTDRQLIFLPDSKTGKKTVVLGRVSVEIIERLRERSMQDADGSRLSSPVSPFVFPTKDFLSPKADLKRPWKLITREAKLDGLRLHDLRHSFASIGASADFGLPIIGKLLGHSSPQTTARYAHLAAAPLRVAADLIGDTISRSMQPNRGETTTL